MKQFTVSSLVQFSNTKWYVSGELDAEHEHDRLLGVSLLIGTYFAHLYALVKVDKNARLCLESVLFQPVLLHSYLLGVLEGFAEYYNQSGTELCYGGADDSMAARSCAHMVSYSPDGRYVINFKPSGFGLLGRGVEFSAVGACLATSQYYADMGPDFEFTVFSTIERLGKELLSRDKISVSEEARIIHEIALDVVPNVT